MASSAADFPITSRNAPAHISINSLPISDNEALNFDNRYVSGWKVGSQVEYQCQSVRDKKCSAE